MSIKLNREELKKTLELFHTLCGIRIVVFDADFNEVMAYPENFCPFCREIRSSAALTKCIESDRTAFEKCRTSGKMYISKCHAGMTEAAMPLKDEEKIIGYIMFGQITNIKDKNELANFVEKTNEKYKLNCSAKGIKFRSERQINAAANLLEMCTDYILLKEMITPANSRITSRAKEYIAQHMGEDIKIADICVHSGASRTKLYEIFRTECGVGIAAYIRSQRLQRAAELIKSGGVSVAEAAAKVGFADYNYFSRVFKRKFGISPHKFGNRIAKFQ